MQEDYQSDGYYIFPASYAQKRLWFLDELLMNNPAYTLSFPIRIRGRLNQKALIDSLQFIVQRHEALRTFFRYGDGQLMQVVVPKLRLTIPTISMKGLSNHERDERAIELAHQEALQAFVLSKGPLIRASLVQFDEDDFVFLLSIHHIIFDGWSVHVFFKELEELYQSFTQNEPVNGDELEIQYGDYAVWQEDWVQSEDFQDQMQYWKEQLKGYRPLLEIPTDRPRMAKSSMSGRSYDFVIPSKIANQLALLGKEEGTTMFMTYLTAFQLFLYRYSGQEDFCVGSLHANRSLSGVERMIGFFVNTIVHRARIQHGITFRERLNQVRQECLDRFSFAEVPFDKIVEELQVERNLHHTPLFQVLFECQNDLIGADPFQLIDTDIEWIQTESVTSKFDLSLYIRQDDDTVWGMFEYNHDLFDDETIQWMANHFLILLEKVVNSPDQPVEMLSLLTDQEWKNFERDLLTTIEPDQTYTCIHTLFESQVERNPDAIAVEYEGDSLTYRELNRRANQVAHLLYSKGVKQEDLVGICMGRCMEMIIAILGILKAGAAYVPIDPSSPLERIEYILEDANVLFLLSTNDETSELSSNREVIDLSDVTQLESYPSDSPQVQVGPRNLAYVIYTSGSTGKPKGVMVEHANVHRLFTETEDWYHFNDQDVWTLFHSYAFDFSVWEIWGALLHGGKLVVVPYWMTRSPESFYQLLADRKVTILNQTPSSFKQLIQVDLQQLSSDLHLRYVIFGGEALDFRSLRPWFERHGDTKPQLVNMYGITETTVHVTYRVIRQEDSWESYGSYIGTPIPDLKIYLLDEHLQPVPTCVFGEMYIEGAGLSRGYFNQPHLAAERFIPNPFTTHNNRKLYKTGDLARLLPNGELEYGGRIDSQVKLRGFRIELEEIEAALLEHASVREAIVAVKRFPSGQEGLVGYVCFKEQVQEIQQDQLRSFLKEKLPEYMVPSVIIPISDIPLTINGKTDRSALPTPDFEGMSRSRPYFPPNSEEERIMVEIWKHVLQVESVGVEDHYFELGGDSIRSLQILYQAREAGLYFTMQDLFKYPTIRSLITKLQSQDVEYEETSRMLDIEVPSAYQNVEDIYPMSQSQIGMVYHSQLDATYNLYHNVHSFHLQGLFSEEAWKKAIADLIVRHPILRTSFDLVHSSQPIQIVHRNVETPLSCYDLQSLSAEEQESYIEQYLLKERNIPLNLADSPIIRFSLLRRNQDIYQLVITEHHAVLDGWSVATMQSELFQLYLYHLQLAEPLPDAPLSRYKDFIVLEQQAIKSVRNKRFWEQQLADFQFNQLPRLKGKTGKEHQADMKYDQVHISKKLSKQIKELALFMKVPIKSVLLASHIRVLSYLCNQDVVTTGVVWNGRPEKKDSERVLGMFLNTLPFCVKRKDGTWSDLIREVFAIEQAILPYRHYPLAQIQQDLRMDSLFETFFNFTHFTISKEIEQNPHIQIMEECSYADTNFVFGAEFSVDPVTSDLQLHLRWDGNQFLIEQIERIKGYYQTALHQMVTNPDGDYLSMDLLSDTERKLLLEEWNQTEKDYPIRPLHEMFEEQVARTPDQIALIFEQTEWTYHHLNLQANKIANALKGLGIRSNDKVGLLFERSLELVASLYGILKAGGAYVPIDPEYPTDRLAFLMEDSDITILITQQKWLNQIPSTSAIIVTVEELLAQSESDEFCSESSCLDCMAYMIYTSGSTGKPKGVKVTHRSISNRLLWMQHQYHLTREDVVLQKTPYSFDVSVWEFFWPLITGARLVMARPDGHKDPQYIADLIESKRITTLHFVPSMLSLFVEEAKPEKCSSIQRVFCSGEALSLQLQNMFFERFQTSLHNLYGPTEAAVDVTFWECRPELELNMVPIGRPVANTSLYIVDDRLLPVPIGTPGELLIGGIQIALGYHNRDSLTLECFIPNPFKTDDRLYKTGDVARYLPDGTIEYLGRNDDQIKIRGFRIELGEIEAVLHSHPMIHKSVVLVKNKNLHDPILVAYAVADMNKKKEIEEYLVQKLPLYMIPQLVLLDDFPVTHNGKLDRKALLEVEIDLDPNHERVIVEPNDELEAKLMRIWEKVLNYSPISMLDHFYEIGGHSIAAVRAMSQINEVLGTNFPLSVFLTNTSIRKLASYIRESNQQSFDKGSSLIRFGSKGQEEIPLFFVHPIGGSVFCYTRLAAHLEQEFAIYAFQSVGLDGVNEAHTSVEEMATTYLNALRSVQKKGPYYIGGWSFGGVIAYEMVRQLQDQGEEIALLLLIDSHIYHQPIRQDEWSENDLLRSFIEDLLQIQADEVVTHNESLSALNLPILVDRLQECDALPKGLDLQRVEILYHVYQANVKAKQNYFPEKLEAVDTLLIRSTEQIGDPLYDEKLGWAHVIDSPIKIVDIEGNHYSVLQEPAVKEIAQLLRTIKTRRL